MKEIIKKLYNCKNVYGPYNGNDNRQRCVLYFDDQTTTSRSYAKLLLEVKLGRRLTPQEEADHINDDHTDDSENNIQLLSREQNIQKQREYIDENLEVYGFHCAVCETPFLMKKHARNQQLKQSTTGLAFCNPVCSNIHRTEQNSISDECRRKIHLHLENGKSTSEVALLVGVSEKTVRKYKNK
jgi:hypothetical protein